MLPFQQRFGNMWAFAHEYDALCILTNRIVRDGKNIMDGGSAYEAAKRDPELPKILGTKILGIEASGITNDTAFTDVLELRPAAKPAILAFMTKEDFRNKSDPDLIRQSAIELMQLIDLHQWNNVLLPRPGCGLGGLSWEMVSSILIPILDQRVTIVAFNK